MKQQTIREQRREIAGLKKQLAVSQKQLAASQKQCQNLRESWSYRIGQKIMWLPGKIKRLLGKE